MKKPNVVLNSMAIFAVASLLTLSSAHASKGGGSTGGGDAMLCSGFLGGSDESHAELADVSKNQSWVQPSFFNSFSLNDVRQAIKNYLLGHQKNDVLSALAELQFVHVQTIPELQTGFSPSLWQKILDGCKKAQLAAQDSTTHIVRIYDPAYNKLTVIEQAFLEIHEAYIDLEMQKDEDYNAMEANARASTEELYLHAYSILIGETPYLKDVLNQWVQKELGRPYAEIDPDKSIGSLLFYATDRQFANSRAYFDAANDLNNIIRQAYNRDFGAKNLAFNLKVSKLADEVGAVVNP